MTAGLFELASVILIAAVLGGLARLLKQPLILAYLATGALVAYLGFFNIRDQATLRVFSDLGIMFLLFLVGLEINFESLRRVGRAAAIIGLGQIIFTSFFGFWIARAFDFAPLPAAYIAIALTFSSTIIIVKLLSEKKDLHSLYGKISIGFMLVQDFVAILILIALAGVEAGGGIGWLQISTTLLKGVGLFVLILWLGRKILPLVFDRFARSGELLFLASLAWVFLLAAVVSQIGFSIEIAGFLAGLGLANSAEHYEIASRIRSLRDFFILVFFVLLGASLFLADFGGLLWPTVVFSLFVLIGNPLIVLILMGAMGYRKRTGFLAGVTVAQISEFSLVLVVLGEKVGHLGSTESSLITAVGIITILVSTYLILYGENIYRHLARFLTLFERRRTREPDTDGPISAPIILIGAHRVGQEILSNLPAESVLVVDFDPDVIAKVAKRGYAHIYGDVSDLELLERIEPEAVKLVISTSPDLQDGLGLLEQLNQFPVRPKIVVRAETEEDARVLYVAGADYVLLPHFTSGQYLGKVIAYDPAGGIFESLRKRDLESLKERDLDYRTS